MKRESPVGTSACSYPRMVPVTPWTPRKASNHHLGTGGLIRFPFNASLKLLKPSGRPLFYEGALPNYSAVFFSADGDFAWLAPFLAGPTIAPKDPSASNAMKIAPSE
jgi:hypothetical protein